LREEDEEEKLLKGGLKMVALPNGGAFFIGRI